MLLGAALAVSASSATTAARADDPAKASGDAARADDRVEGAVEAARGDDRRFRFDVVSDGTVVIASAGFSGLAALVLSTGEIAPQRPGSPSNVLSLDRIAITQTVDPNAGTLSNVGLGLALGYAVLDPVLSGTRDGGRAALVDLALYAESLSVTLALVDIAKVAVRRPRPIAYVEQAALDKATPGGAASSPSITQTDSVLSFPSGHAAIVAATTATASYLAFRRSPKSWRPWVTLGLGFALTAGVSYERVRAGMHFPTDVVAGSLLGAAVGVIVPHLHRSDLAHRSYWIGFAPVPGGGELACQGIF